MAHHQYHIKKNIGFQLMINIKTIKEFSDESMEGKLLLAALSILSSEEFKSGRYGGHRHVDDVMKDVVRIANSVYYEKEYEQWLKEQERIEKINKVIE